MPLFWPKVELPDHRFNERCCATDPLPPEVEPEPDPFEIDVDCREMEVYFDSGIEGADSYLWDFGGQATSSSPMGKAPVNLWDSGDVLVTLTVTVGDETTVITMLVLESEVVCE